MPFLQTHRRCPISPVHLVTAFPYSGVLPRLTSLPTETTNNNVILLTIQQYRMHILRSTASLVYRTRPSNNIKKHLKRSTDEHRKSE